MLAFFGSHLSFVDMASLIIWSRRLQFKEWHSTTSLSSGGVGGQHLNVLAYVNSWEQDDALYVQTELCELDNSAHFLGEFGRKYPTKFSVENLRGS